MAVAIRMRRTGTLKKPRFRIVVADKRSPRDGRFLEILGSYNPTCKTDNEFTLNLERYDYWIGVGAQASPTVKKLIVKERAKKSS